MTHTKRYKKLNQELCKEAIKECFKNKWLRNDILTHIEKYSGIPRIDIEIDTLQGTWEVRNEALDAMSLALLGMAEDLVEQGIEPDDMEPVTIRQRPDGMTGKVRDIALLCVTHQLLGHLAKKMIEPLLNARLLPTQHASIPGHGQTRLKDQMHRFFLRESIGITYVQKTDVVHAYESTQYSVPIELIRKEIPGARYALGILDYLATVAPGGHLIIGGYLDAWLFNFSMSYAIRYLYTLGTTRRGKKVPYVIRCGTFMDDFCITSASIKGEQRAVKMLSTWLEKNQGLRIKKTTGIIKLLPIEEEQRRRQLPKPSQRGVPMLDMAGYRISRSHVTIRRRVFKRTRRQLLRASRELKRDGTLHRQRAQKLVSYNSYIEQSNSENLQEKYNLSELMTVAHRVNGFYGRLAHKRRMEELHVLRERRRREQAGKGYTGSSSRRKENGSPGGQGGRVHTGRHAGSENVPVRGSSIRIASRQHDNGGTARK